MKIRIIVAVLTMASATALQATVQSRRVVQDETCGIRMSETAYTYYRFVIKRIGDKVPWESDDSEALGSHKWVRIREIGLYDASGNLVSGGLIKTTASLKEMPYGSCFLSGRIGTGSEEPEHLFDGTNLELSTWCNPNPLPNFSWSWGYVYMRLPENAAPVCGYNIAMSAREYEVAGWSLEGSMDGANWIVLDERSEADSAAFRADGNLSDFGWYSRGEAFKVWQDGNNPSASHYFVESGGRLSVQADATLAGVSSYGGTVEIASGVTAGMDVAAGLTARILGGGLAGDGTLEKRGEGTLTVSGVNSSFVGTLKVSDGTLRFAPVHMAPRYETYRFVAKKKDSNEKLKLSEVAVYDAAGNRINQGLSFVEYSVATNPSGTTMDMPYGSCSQDGQSTPWQNKAYPYDGDLTTDWYGWVQSSGAEWAWLYFYMRPAVSQAAPVAYNVASSSDNLYNPITWALQGSQDGIVWDTLDEVAEARRAEIFPATAQAWCNGGTPMSFLAEGCNAPTREISAKYFKFSIKAFGTGGEGGTRAISELGLYDRTGRRVNLHLVNQGREVSVASLPARSFTYHNAGWEPTYNADSTHAEKMFDGDLSTRLSGWNFADCSSEYNWITFTMRLADDALPVAAYSIAAYSPNNPNTLPVAWSIAASADGVSWSVVDERSGDAAAELLPFSALTTPTFYNNGHPIGFARNCPSVLSPYRATVEVAKGARLELPPENDGAYSALSVDLTQEGACAGVIVNFRAAATGTIDLKHARRAPRLNNVELPIAFEGLVDGANLLNWTITVNGEPKDCYKLSWVDGRLHIDGGLGVLLILR